MDRKFILPNRPSHLANNVSARIQFFRLSIDSFANMLLDWKIHLSLFTGRISSEIYFFWKKWIGCKNSRPYNYIIFEILYIIIS